MEPRREDTRWADTEQRVRRPLWGLSFLPVERGGWALSAGELGPSGVGCRKGGEGGGWLGGAGQEWPSPGGAHKRAMCPPWAVLGPWAAALGLGIWLRSEALLCFLFNYDGLGSYKSSFCWGSLGEGGWQGWPVWGWRGSTGRGSVQNPLSVPWEGGCGASGRGDSSGLVLEASEGS